MKGVNLISVSKRLSRVLSTATIIPFDNTSKFVIMSDCHRGDGTWSDNFLKNENIFFTSLNSYYKKGFTYIELGDGDELWENRKLSQIISTHNDNFLLLSKFYQDGRLYMIYGNHDMVKRDNKYTFNQCTSFYDETTRMECDLFPNINISEALLLKENGSGNQILLTHGHQGNLMNDTLWKLSRFLVRYLWHRLELLGFNDPTSAAKNNIHKNNAEKKLIKWSKQNKQMLITGHTHRPVFPKVGEPLYFNDGCCIHPRRITAIEIYKGTISLVKWSVKTRNDRSLFIDRDVIEGPVLLSDYFNSV